MRIKVGKIGYYVSASICLIVCTSISGYTGNRVSLLTRQPTGAPIKASEVKLFPRFNDIKRTLSGRRDDKCVHTSDYE